MAVYFFDTSALVKRYVSETGSDAVTAIVEAPETIVVIADLTRAEITSAISRRKRTGHLSADDYEALKVVIARHLATEYLLVPIDTERINAACGLIEQHGLRAYDAIQLATALSVRAIVAPHGARPSFVSADDSLLNAARSEGLPVLNPAAP